MTFLVKRIKGDSKIIANSKSNGIEYDFWTSDNITQPQVMIFGPDDSCYEGCILYFHILLPDNYPMQPPIFKFITPINKRFHPNFYADGKVCMTILNTWNDANGSGWTSATTLESVFTAIRSLMDDNPLAQEPQFRGCKIHDEPNMKYHICAKYYALENTFSYFDYNLPEELKIKMHNFFKKNIDKYKKTIDFLKQYDKQQIDCFHCKVIIDINKLETKLQYLSNII